MPSTGTGWIGFRNNGSVVGGLNLYNSIIEALEAQGGVDHGNAEYFLSIRDDSRIQAFPFTRQMDRLCYELAGLLALPGSLTDQTTAVFKVRKAWLEFYSGWILDYVYRNMISEAKFWEEPNGLIPGRDSWFLTLLSPKRSERVLELLNLVRGVYYGGERIISHSEIEPMFVMVAGDYITNFRQIWERSRSTG